MAHGDILIAKVPLSWKKSFGQGVLVPHKKQNCTECKIKTHCDRCNKLINPRKVLSAI